MTRILALLRKELVDIRGNRSLFMPALISGAFSLLLPFFVAVLVPALSGERLSDSIDFRVALELYRAQPITTALEPEAAIQAWLFQQFLVLLAFTPITAAMSVAAYAVIGEKQARTLEPLLATPISTVELIAAKVLGAFLPSLVLAVGCYLVYLALIVMLALPGVWTVLLLPRSLATMFVLAPLATLAALQLAVCVSSRVNDARSAQQIGALIILPLSGLMVAQLMGGVQLTAGVLAWIALGLGLFNVGLMRLAVVLFDRESILTRWT